ncbi:hypothetical protein K7432_013364 [Basidiobolus ranarum]|uniref:Fucose-specific lectin n=1 Tax=Basidiobolus ranarum TaxID=34480 RepID=A0ABR2WJE1_9FUNG
MTYNAEKAVDSKSGLEATFYAVITIAGHPLRIIRRKDAKYGSHKSQTYYHYKFKPEDLPHPLDRGNQYTISAYSVKGSARGVWSSIEFKVPDVEVADTYWTGPFETRLGDIFSNASLHILQHTQDLYTYALWSTSNGKVVYQHTENDVVWQTEAFETIADNTTAVIPDGSSFSCAYLSELHQEIYWIGPDGSIQERRQQVDPNDTARTARVWSTIDNFPFPTPKAPSIEKGGSISAVAHHDGTRIDLWWVDDKQSLIKATFTTNPEKWTGASVLVSGEIGPSGTAGGGGNNNKSQLPSRLAGCAANGLYTYLMWITSSGHVQGERTYESNLHGYIYSFRDEDVDAVNAIPTSSLAMLARPGASTRMWWISPNGSVLTAVQFQAQAPPPISSSTMRDKEKAWHIFIVSGYQSASVHSEIVAVYLNDNDLRVFWVSPNNRLMSAKAGLTKVVKTEWQLTGQLPAVKMCKAVGEQENDGVNYLRKYLVAVPLGEKKIGVWYVSIDGKII